MKYFAEAWCGDADLLSLFYIDLIELKQQYLSKGGSAAAVSAEISTQVLTRTAHCIIVAEVLS